MIHPGCGSVLFVVDEGHRSSTNSIIYQLSYRRGYEIIDEIVFFFLIKILEDQFEETNQSSRYQTITKLTVCSNEFIYLPTVNSFDISSLVLPQNFFFLIITRYIIRITFSYLHFYAYIGRYRNHCSDR